MKCPSPALSKRLIRYAGGPTKFARRIGLKNMKGRWLAKVSGWQVHGIPAVVVVEYYDQIKQLLQELDAYDAARDLVRHMKTKKQAA